MIDELKIIEYAIPMGIITSQQITAYYDMYRDAEIIFSKEVIKALNLDPRQIYIKCMGSQWPCIINSASFLMARIIIGTKGAAYTAIRKLNTPVSLRFYFNDYTGQTMSFFVNARVTKMEAYMNSTDLVIVTLTFNQKPPDDLIEIVGRLLDTKANSLKRREERIIITADSKRRLNLMKEETVVYVQNVPRNCILRDISFSGAKVIIMGIAAFLKEKETVLWLEFDEPRETIKLPGKVVKVENVTGRKDLVSLSIKFIEEEIPISFKFHINTCITGVRQRLLNQATNNDSDIPEMNVDSLLNI